MNTTQTNQALKQDILNNIDIMVEQYQSEYPQNKNSVIQKSSKLATNWCKQFYKENSGSFIDFFYPLLKNNENVKIYFKNSAKERDISCVNDGIKIDLIGKKTIMGLDNDCNGLKYQLDFFRKYDKLLNLNIDYQKMDILFDSENQVYYMAMVSMSKTNWKQLFIQAKQDNIALPLQKLVLEENKTQFLSSYYYECFPSADNWDKIGTYFLMNDTMQIDNNELELQNINATNPFIVNHKTQFSLLHYIEYTKLGKSKKYTEETIYDNEMEKAALYLDNQFNLNIANIDNITNELIDNVIIHLDECSNKAKEERAIWDNKINVAYKIYFVVYMISYLYDIYKITDIVLACTNETNATKFEHKHNKSLYVITDIGHDSNNEIDYYVVNSINSTGTINNIGKKVYMYDFEEQFQIYQN